MELLSKIPVLKKVITDFRKSKLGQYCKMMYDDHR